MSEQVFYEVTRFDFNNGIPEGTTSRFDKKEEAEEFVKTGTNGAHIVHVHEVTRKLVWDSLTAEPASDQTETE